MVSKSRCSLPQRVLVMATEKSENQVFWDFGEANSGVEPVKTGGVRHPYRKTGGRIGAYHQRISEPGDHGNGLEYYS